MANENNTRARDGSIRAINPPSRARRVILSRRRQAPSDDAYIRPSVHRLCNKPSPKHEPYPNRASNSERESHTRPRRFHPNNTIPHRGRDAPSDIDAIGRRVYKVLAIIGVSINQPLNLSLIRIDHATPNEFHTCARDASIRAIKSPIAGAASHPTSTPTGAIGRRVYKDLAFIGFSINPHQIPPKLEPYTNRARHTKRKAHTRPRCVHPRNTIPHRGRAASYNLNADWRLRTTRI